MQPLPLRLVLGVAVAVTVCVPACAPSDALAPPEDPGGNPPGNPPGALVPPWVDHTVVLAATTTVFDAPRDGCAGLDLPDVPARAFRRPGTNQIVVVAGNAPVNFLSEGVSFDALVRNCTVPALVSVDDPTAPTFANQEWLHSPYVQGTVVHALVHNEYHDPVPAGCKPGFTDTSNPCWYNAITYARSTDGGRRFTADPAPSRVAVAPTLVWQPPTPSNRSTQPYGAFSPSNIVRGSGGWYYVMFFVIHDPATPALRGACLMRTQSLGDASSWRAWDGAAFTVRMGSPYVSGAATPRGCALVGRDSIGGASGSLTWNSYLQRWMVIGAEAVGNTCGFWYALSADLITWSKLRLLKSQPVGYGPCPAGPGGSNFGAYPSIIDHADTTANFERAGATPYLYWMQAVTGNLDRKLMRARVTFTKP